jgi:undecaprenyl-diphosphatase
MKKFLLLVNKTSLTRLLFIKIVVGLIVNFIVLFSFFFLTHDVLEKETLFYDKTISNFVYSFRVPILTTVMSTITNITDMPAGLVLSLLVVLLLFKKHKKESLIFSLSLIIGCVLNYLLKIFFKLPRPNIAPLEVLSDFTYPSGHAMNNLVLYGLLAFYAFHFTKNKSLSIVIGFIALVWIFLIGLSRIYLGAHYPSDVLAGYFVGFWWFITILIIDKTISFSKEIKRFRE